MPKKVSTQELDELKNIIEKAPTGISVSELLEMESVDYTRRTLQRRLEELLTKNLISSLGEGRGRRYHQVKSSINTDLPVARYHYVLKEEPAKYGIIYDKKDWLSDEAKEIKQIMLKPTSERTPVGYNTDFLLDYIPNESFYLPEETRKELAQLGGIGTDEMPAGTYLRNILSRLLIDLSWNSSRLEGNTYSLLETEILLKQGLGVEGKKTEETQMILNHKAAIEMLADQAEEIGFNAYTIYNLHALLSDNLLSNQQSCGRLRDCAVGIGSSVYHPLDIPQQIEECFQQILEKAEAINDPFEASFFVMVHLPYLQGFEDVNKRLSRLAANIPMIQKNLSPLSYSDMETDDYLHAILAVYELNRVEYLRDLYVWAYKRSCQRYSAVKNILGDPNPFILKHRISIKETVQAIVLSGKAFEDSHEMLMTEAIKSVPEDEHEKFIQVIKAELASLHMGNIARYRLRPKEFTIWMNK